MSKKIVKKKKYILPERKEKIDRERTMVVGMFFLFAFLFLFGITFLSVAKLQITNTYRGVNLDEYSQSIYTSVESIESERGIITDVNGNQLAVNVNTYDMYATLCDPKAEPETIPACVSDGKNTATQLLEVMGLSGNKEAVELFNQQLSIVGPGQVEFGSFGKGLNVEQKEAIEALKLPGIKFNTYSTRYYPYGDFASYVIGYTKTNEDGTQVGEMGIEKDLDPYLRGITGYEIVSKDGNEIPIMSEQQQQLTKKTDGANVELTIDAQIQTYVQEEMNARYAGHEFEQAFTVVMDVHTGAILAMYALDSFDPNVRNVKNYNNPVSDYCYEPGSTIKSFVVATAMETGVWDPNKVVPTGKREKEEWGEGKYVADWLYNDYGMSWGDQPYYKGLYYSSNTIMTYILDDIGYDVWLKYMRDVYLFGKPVNSGFMDTAACEMNPVYALDYANTSFGQGMTVNAMQMMRAYSIFGNDGKMVQPHYVNKMYDPETGEAFYDAATDKSLEPKQTISKETADAMLKELEQVVYYTEDGKPAYYNGSNYYLKDGKVRVGGKTGSAEVVTDGKYATDIISSNMAFAPIDDPQILVYTVVVKPQPVKPITYSTEAMSAIIDKTIAYLSQTDVNKNIDTSSTNRLTLKNYNGTNIGEANAELTSQGIRVITIGEGAVTAQYPPATQVVSTNDTVVLRASGDYDPQQLIGKTYNDVNGICKVMDWKCKISGVGNVESVTNTGGNNYEVKLASPPKLN